jgi:hypothetical protein
MRFPTVILERKKISRVIFSMGPPTPHQQQGISSLMEKVYKMGVWCFDLPSSGHLKSFKELRHLVKDETLTGLCHLDVEEGVSLFGKPLHQFESKVVSTMIKNIIPPGLARNLFPTHHSHEVFTQKEIDRMIFDSSRFDKALSLFNLEEVPFLLVGGKYGDWLLGLGRFDLLKEMISKVREKGFIPIFWGQWATFVLPKVKPLDAAAYAIPINKKRSLFDLAQACDIIKKFEKPIISLNPLADGRLLKRSEEAFSFLFDKLKIYSTITEVASEEEVRKILGVLTKIPSLIPFRKT